MEGRGLLIIEILYNSGFPESEQVEKLKASKHRIITSARKVLGLFLVCFTMIKHLQLYNYNYNVARNRYWNQDSISVLRPTELT